MASPQARLFLLFLMVKEVRDWASRTLRGKYRRAATVSDPARSGSTPSTFYNAGRVKPRSLALKLYFHAFSQL